jgi:hypothetical protein
MSTTSSGSATSMPIRRRPRATPAYDSAASCRAVSTSMPTPSRSRAPAASSEPLRASRAAEVAQQRIRSTPSRRAVAA